MRAGLCTPIVVIFPILLSGFNQLHEAALPHGKHAMTTSTADGTFLLDSQTGKVWHYSAKDDAFLEMPVTSKSLRYERGPDGKCA